MDSPQPPAVPASRDPPTTLTPSERLAHQSDEQTNHQHASGKNLVGSKDTSRRSASISAAGAAPKSRSQHDIIDTTVPSGSNNENAEVVVVVPAISDDPEKGNSAGISTAADGDVGAEPTGNFLQRLRGRMRRKRIAKKVWDMPGAVIKNRKDFTFTYLPFPCNRMAR